MHSPTRVQHPFWSVVPLEVVACTLVFLVALATPLEPLDEWVNGQLLVAVGRTEPPRSVLLLTLDANATRDGCAGRLIDALQRGGARGALLIPPAEDLCRVRDSVGARRPIATLPRDAARTTSGNRVVGWSPRAADRATLAAFGLQRAPWVAPRRWRSMPSVPLAEVVAGRVPPDVLTGRIAVVALADPGFSVGAAREPFANSVAAALAAAIEDRPRAWLASGFVALLTAAVAALLMGLSRLRLPAPARTAGRALLAAGVLGGLAAGVAGYGYLVGLPSSALALVLGLTLQRVPRALAARRAVAAARQLLADAEQLGPARAAELEDPAFWGSLARRAAQAHPADGVLVAELPPAAWRLRFHANGDLTEAVVSERRRDIRRTPFTDEAGTRRAHVHHGFLAMKDVPTVIVPLEAEGEPEGYLFLLGAVAERAFLDHPERTQRLALRLAQLIRQRRLERHRAAAWRRPGGVHVDTPSHSAARLVDGARGALQRLELVNAALAAAPVGLVHADSFGDVRAMSDVFRDAYCSVGGQTPASGPSGVFGPGALLLGELLDTLTRAASHPRLHLDELPEEPVTFTIPGAVREPPSDAALLVSVRRFSSGELPGTVVTMTEVASAGAASESPANVERFPERGDPLVVFSLAQLLRDVVENVERRTSGSIKLQTPRIHAHVVGHRRELTAALGDFLAEAAGDQGKRQAPILTLRERQHRVELTVMDVQLGAPAAAVKRTLLAPSQPPPGLGGLGALTRAVENSHGSVAFRQEEGWGIRLTASFVRAHPRVEVEPTAAVVALPPAAKVPDTKS